MDCSGDDESQRHALRSLSRRDLQKRAKDLNVRANRKSIDIIEGIIKASRSRPASPRDGREQASPQVVVKAGSTRMAGDDAENASPTLGVVKGTNCCATAATPQPHSSTAVPSTTPLPPPTICASAPTASAPIASLTPVTTSNATPSVPAAAAPTTPFAFPLTATTPGLHHPPATTGLGGRSLATFSDLAAKASAMALAAALNNLKLDTELKASAVKAAPASILKARGLAGVAAGGPAVRGGGLTGCGVEENLLSRPDAREEKEQEEEEGNEEQQQQAEKEQEEEEGNEEQQQQAEVGSGKSVRTFVLEPANMTKGHAQDAFVGGAHDSGAASSAMEFGDHASAPAGSSGAAAGEDREEHTVRRLAFDASPPAATTPCPNAARAAPQLSENSPAASSSSGSAGPPSWQAPVPTAANPAWDLDEIAACPAETPWALRVTGRTPLRTQRQLGLLGPGPVSSMGVGGAGAAGVPTPARAAVLRTPARRVAADGVDVEVQAAEAWVEERLVVPGDRVLAAGAPRWQDLVGLQEAKQRLRDLCLLRQAPGNQEHAPQPSASSTRAQPSVRAQPTSSSTGTSTSTAAVTTRARSSTSTVTAPGGKAAVASISARGASAAKMSSSSCTGNAAPTRTTRSTAAATAATPKKPSTVPTESAPAQADPMQWQLPARHAAAVLCGPDGVGKASLARALAAEAGARLIEVPTDLLDPVAYPTTAKAAATIRAVFKVAARGPGPCVVLLRDVEQLLGGQALQGCELARRLRAELMLAVDELLQPSRAGPTAEAEPGAPAACASSAAGSSGRRGVLVLATTATLGALDEPLVAALGRTAVLHVALPDADAREALLLGRLLAAGTAELGVPQVEELVRRTEGSSCAQLAELCGRAVQAARQRQQQEGRRVVAKSTGPKSAAGNPPARRNEVVVCEQDLAAALQQVVGMGAK